MSSKGQGSNKPPEKGAAKAGSAKTGSKDSGKPAQGSKSTGKSTSSQKPNSGSAKASSSHSSKSTGAKSSSSSHSGGKPSQKAQDAKKKHYQQEKAKYEASVSSSSKKQADSYELYGDDISLEVVTGHSRDQARGRRPRTKQRKTKSIQNKRNTVGLSSASQDQLLNILKHSTWSNVNHMDYATEPSIEDNTEHLTKGLGFRRFEALQALQYAKNHYDIALEWLVIHVPNDHLPLGFKSSTASAKIEIMDINSQSHLRKRMVRRLESYGFLKSQCQRELEVTNDDEKLALYHLLESFLTRDSVSTMRKVRKSTPMTPEYIEELKTMREDEFSMLGSILGQEGENATKNSDFLITISIPLTLRYSNNEKKNITLTLEIHFPPENHYPHELPLFALTCEDLKSEVLYAFTRQIAIEANQFIGQPLIYPIISWIHSTAPRTLPSLSKTFDDPEKCKDAHSKYGKTLREDEMEREALKQVKKEIRAQTSSSAPPSNPETPTPSEIDSIDANVNFEEGFRLLNLEVMEEKLSKIEKTESQKARIATKSKELLEKFKSNRESNEQFRKMLSARSQLPAYQNRLKILDLLHGPNSQVVLISGATGCGKTTQIAQIILDDMIERGIGGECSIICTQPRRISAVSVAERVAEERCESIGQSVGYSIRLEAQRSEETQVLFVTTGVLLRKLQNDPFLRDVSHVIVDEVHERDLNSDFLLIILKQLIQVRTDLQLILMSATLNADSFAEYFNGCPTIEIPGRTFPVSQFLLEDVIEATKYQLDARSPYASGGRKFKLYEGYSVNTSNVMSLLNRKKINYELITKLVEHIFTQFEKTQGGILIFLPGMVEIATMIDHLSSSHHSRKMTILPLHSSLSTDQQQRIFKKPAQGTRKVVVSTNIAETSVTVEDVVFVIDSCRVKEVRYDGHIESLVEDWTSKASMRQRMGRAGRVQSGFCWSMVAKDRHQHLAEFQDPEMLRVPLDSLILQIRVLKMGDPKKFLSLALNPPASTAIASAIQELQQLGAFDENEHLTPLGYHLGKLPVSPKIGKMLIYGAIFKCLSPILTICAALSDKAPFISSFENREDAEDSKLSWDKDDEYSDHLTIVKAYEAWEDVTSKGSDNSWCRENYLSKPTLINIRDLRKQFRQILKDSGFTHDSNFHSLSREEKMKRRKAPGGDDMNSNEVKIIKSILCAGLYPNIASLRPIYDAAGGITSTIITTKDGEEVLIHPSSVLGKAKKFPGNFLVFHDRVLTSRLFLREVTCIGNYAAILFGGNVEVFPEEQSIEIDGWLTLHTSGREGILLSKMRQEIDKMLLAKVVDPKFDVSDKKIASLVVSVIKSESDMLTY